MNNIPKAIGPYSAYREVGNLIFVSGQLPINPQTGKIESEDISKQTIQSLKNIEAILRSKGGSLKDIVKTTILLDNIENFPIMNEAYGEVLEEQYPARSAYQVAALPMGAHVEIEVIASIDSKQD
ncbi:Rid family detoxifying hydrolase [Melissococcus plutonius]|uniref:RidAYER057cUK114 superfamily protein n=1 Tax=Melissococcus plutonius TaxID=33970 RepID=A0A2Z5Y1D6_9ENTE|nr:Rid family detoxifying hydrolase [Melissococcus plutonius]BAL61799.1 endoribonuclease L-PSP [Melissococcus plutonius DAT561]MCV2498256.1 Rid family detoxifying hydrolase [Melissococcus plutonius]MCV2501675.1 Rid family detoxifying hydrolase [Melissococcus plutonius]MCV2504633.1 Rid family detoxifying hydrolase [Melissococcus plutonius]MCV2506871.1 Rid family detoxifying hydrolase [Melissococcus plutonius]